MKITTAFAVAAVLLSEGCATPETKPGKEIDACYMQSCRVCPECSQQFKTTLLTSCLHDYANEPRNGTIEDKYRDAMVDFLKKYDPLCAEQGASAPSNYEPAATSKIESAQPPVYQPAAYQPPPAYQPPAYEPQHIEPPTLPAPSTFQTPPVQQQKLPPINPPPQTMGNSVWCAIDNWGNRQCLFYSYDACQSTIQTPGGRFVGCVSNGN
jgi:hypothetical protein